MQREREIECGGGPFAQCPADRGAQMPQCRGATQLGFTRDLEVAAQRFQCGSHGLDDELVLMAILGGVGQGRTMGGVGVGVGRSRCRPGERVAAHLITEAGHQQLGACPHQGGAGELPTRRRQIGEVDGGCGIGVDQPVHDRPRVHGFVGAQPQCPGQNHFRQRVVVIAELLQRRDDPIAVLTGAGHGFDHAHSGKCRGRSRREGGVGAQRFQQCRAAADIERQRTDDQVCCAITQCRGGGVDIVVSRPDSLCHKGSGGPAQDEGCRCGHVPVTGARWVVRPRPESWRSPYSNPHTATDAVPKP